MRLFEHFFEPIRVARISFGVSVVFILLHFHNIHIFAQLFQLLYNLFEYETIQEPFRGANEAVDEDNAELPASDQTHSGGRIQSIALQMFIPYMESVVDEQQSSCISNFYFLKLFLYETYILKLIFENQWTRL